LTQLKILRRFEGISKIHFHLFSPYSVHVSAKPENKSSASFFFAVIHKTQWVFLSELGININEECTAVTANSDTFPSQQYEGVIFFFLHYTQSNAFNCDC